MQIADASQQGQGGADEHDKQTGRAGAGGNELLDAH